MSTQPDQWDTACVYLCRLFGDKQLYLELTVIEGEGRGVPLAHRPGAAPCPLCETPPHHCNGHYYLPLYSVISVYEAGEDVLEEGGDVVGVDVCPKLSLPESVVLFFSLVSTSPPGPPSSSTRSASPSPLITTLHVVSSNARGFIWKCLRAAIGKLSKLQRLAVLRHGFDMWVTSAMSYCEDSKQTT